MHLGAAVPKAQTQVTAQRGFLLRAERNCALPPCLVSAFSNRRAWRPTLGLSHARAWRIGELRRPPMITREARVPCPGLTRRGVVRKRYIHLQQHSKLSNMVGKKSKERQGFPGRKGIDVERKGPHVYRALTKECNLPHGPTVSAQQHSELTEIVPHVVQD